MEQVLTPTEPPTERQLLDQVQRTVGSSLPDGWRSELKPAKVADGILALTAPDGRTARLVVEAKSRFDTRDVLRTASDLERAADPTTVGGLVATRYLSPRAREALAETGLSYVDATGNVRVNVAEPGLFILLRGADRDPWRSPDRPTTNLRGKPAARIVRTLADVGRTWKIRDLAGEAGTSLGSTSRTVDYLEREALISRDKSGAITNVDWPALLERWAADYALLRQGRRVVRLFSPRGVGAIQPRLAAWNGRYAISGSLAAARWAPYADARLALVYASDADALAAKLELREAPERPNVLIIEPEDDYVFMRSIKDDGWSFAAPSQVAVDLLAGPGRNPDEGRELIRWMTGNEHTWRQT